MRKLILLITLIGSILCSVAYAGNNFYTKLYGVPVTYEKVDSLSSTLLKNNIKQNYFGEPYVMLTLFSNEERIIFNAYSKIKLGEAYYIFGNGTYNINIICIEGNKVSFPITSNKTMTLINTRFAKVITDNLDSIPDYDGELKEI